MKTNDVELAEKETHESKESSRCLGSEDDAPIVDRKAESKNLATLPSNTPGVIGLRYSLLLMLILWLLCIVLRYYVWDWGSITCELDDTDDTANGMCIRQNAIYRITSVFCLFFFMNGLASLIWVEKAFDNYWLLPKIPLCIAASVCAIGLADANVFDDAMFVWWARIGAFVFIVFQQVIMLDFAYMWNEKWFSYSTPGMIEGYNNNDCASLCSNMWLLLIVIVGLAQLAIFGFGIGMLYYHYGGDGCSTGNTIITISLLGMVIAGITQLSSSKGSILTTTILMLYVLYITYSAVSLNPDPDCNPFADPGDGGKLNFSYGGGPAMVGIAISLISILYMSLITTRAITSILAHGGFTQGALANVVLGKKSGANKMPDMKKKLKSSIFFYNIVYALLSLYLAMIMSNWGLRTKSYAVANPDTSRVAMWMQATASWITILLYVVALVTPALDSLPKSVWDFYPKSGR